MADGFSAGEHARICGPASALLADPGGTAGMLRVADASGEDLVLSPVWYITVFPDTNNSLLPIIILGLPQVQRLRQVHGLDFITPCQIRNRAC